MYLASTLEILGVLFILNHPYVQHVPLFYPGIFHGEIDIYIYNIYIYIYNWGVVERFFDILLSIFCLVVIGSAISKISGTMVELRSMNEARFGQSYARLQKASNSGGWWLGLPHYNILTNINQVLIWWYTGISGENMGQNEAEELVEVVLVEPCEWRLNPFAWWFSVGYIPSSTI